MKLIIETADNGYILRIPDEEPGDFEGDPPKNVEEVSVFEDSESEEKAFENLVYEIARYCGFSYDKYGEENLRISWDKKGHKIDDGIE